MSRFSRHVSWKVVQIAVVAVGIGVVIRGELPVDISAVYPASWLTSLPSYLQLDSLAPEFIGSAVVFVVGLSWDRLRGSVRYARARFFWGGALLRGEFAICHGTISDPRSGTPDQYFTKRYRDGRTIQLKGPYGAIVGDCELRSASHLLNTLASYRRSPVRMEDDVNAYERLSRTLIALGSPSSNELTEIILNETNNRFAEFGQDEVGPFIYLRRSRRKCYGFQGTPRTDLGLVMKIANTRFPGQYFFVCAGLSEWGTSGAAWFLANRWRELDDDGEEFGVVVQVEIGSDESARVLAAVPIGPSSQSEG